MRKPTCFYLVDVAMFSLMSGIIFIGLLLGFVVPIGPTEYEASKYLWGLHRHQWGDIHLYMSLAFVVFLVIHLALHWKWIKGSTRRLLKSGWALVPMVTMPVALLLVFWVFTPADAARYSGYGKHHAEELVKRGLSEGCNKDETGSQLAETESDYKKTHTRHHEFHISGRATLNGIERNTGIPARRIAKKLCLPESASLDERLGRLKRRYSFTMDDVREAVTSMKKHDER